MNNVLPLTNVTVLFNSQNNSTKVTIIHIGWRNAENLDDARKYFVKAWKIVFAELGKIVNEN